MFNKNFLQNRVDDFLIETILEKMEAIPDLHNERFFGFALLNCIASTRVASTWGKDRLHNVIDRLLDYETKKSAAEEGASR